MPKYSIVEYFHIIIEKCKLNKVIMWLGNSLKYEIKSRVFVLNTEINKLYRLNIKFDGTILPKVHAK